MSSRTRIGSDTGIVVVGAGVVGLTTAVRLLERGVRVTVVADRRTPETTSNVAAGLWYPYKVGGARVKRWALESLRTFQTAAVDAESGVRLVKCTSYVNSAETRPYWADADVEYYEGAAERRAYHALLPVAEPAVFLPWLEARIATLGGSVAVLEKPLERLSDLDAELIVNCSGLAARFLCQDDLVVPIRGVVVRVTGTGIDECIADDTDPDTPTYIIPNSGYCVLGGTAEPGNWSQVASNDEARSILARCERLDDRVLAGTVVGAYAGLRPGRSEVRLEVESSGPDKVIVHNYGHGGSGFTLAWGCASEVADIVLKLLG